MSDEIDVVAILDDRKDQRETLRRGITPVLPRGWECRICPLRPTIDDYPSWLLNNNARVLLLDQMLNDQAPESELPVSYRGHDVMQVLRSKIPDLPIVVVTRAVDDADLQESLGYADGIVNRQEILDHADKYVERIVRLGQTYLERNRQSLSELGRLAEIVASGIASRSETEELKALQQALSLATNTESLDSKLDEVSKQLAAIEELEREIRNRLGLGDSES